MIWACQCWEKPNFETYPYSYVKVRLYHNIDKSNLIWPSQCCERPNFDTQLYPYVKVRLYHNIDKSNLIWPSQCWEKPHFNTFQFIYTHMLKLGCIDLCRSIFGDVGKFNSKSFSCLKYTIVPVELTVNYLLYPGICHQFEAVPTGTCRDIGLTAIQ